MDFQQIISQLKKGTYAPIYFLHGPEPYFIDAITDYIEEHALSPSEKAFNLTTIYGKDADHLAIVDAARRYPMMAPRQVVILKEAQSMKGLSDLKTYAEKPSPTTILVICHKHKKLNLNSGFGKALKDNGVIFESKKLYDNQLPDWILQHMKGKGLKMDTRAANLVAEYLGTDLSKVVNELDKLAINLEPGSTVSDALIEKNIGISRDFNVFELQKALGGRSTERVFRIIQYFASNPQKNPPLVVVGSLYNYFSKVYQLHFLRNVAEKDLLEKLNLRSAFFLRDYRLALQHYNLRQTEGVLEILHEYDLKSKGVDFNSQLAPDGDLLKEMMWKILNQ